MSSGRVERKVISNEREDFRLEMRKLDMVMLKKKNGGEDGEESVQAIERGIPKTT